MRPQDTAGMTAEELAVARNFASGIRALLTHHEGGKDLLGKAWEPEYWLKLADILDRISKQDG